MARRWVSFERVDLWRCGACQGLRERQKAEAVKRLYEAILEAVRVFRDSTIDAQEQAAEAARFAFSRLCACWRSCVESRAPRRGP